MVLPRGAAASTFARRHVRQRPTARFTEDQKAFLLEQFNCASRVRGKAARRRMLVDLRFKDKLHPKTNRPLVLEQRGKLKLGSPTKQEPRGSGEDWHHHLTKKK